MKRFVLLLAGVLGLMQPLAAQPVFREGAKAPNFTVEMLDGRQSKLSRCRGRVVMLSFWATWCKPCLKELHEMPEKILKRFEKADFILIAIDKGEPRTTVERKVAELVASGLEFPLGLDPL